MDDTHFLETNRSTVSVIIPTYNDAHYLGEALQSVLDQTYQDFEIIVVDDGSKDDPYPVVEAFGDSRIQYIRQENKGLPGARNTGIKAATGEYIAFLDADDTFLPHKLETQVAFLEKHPEIDLVAGGWHTINERGEIFKTTEPWRAYPILSVKAVILDVPLMVHSVLLRKSSLQVVGLYDEKLKWHEDGDFWRRFAVSGSGMDWGKYVVCKRRWHDNNMSHNLQEMYKHELYVLEKLYKCSNLPEEALTIKNRAYAKCHMRFVAWLCLKLQFNDAKVYIDEAVRLDPKLLEGEPPLIAQRLICDFYDHPFMVDRDVFFWGVLHLLANFTPTSTDKIKSLISQQYMSDFFNAYNNQNYQNVLRNLYKGLRYDFSWIRNVGVWSIGIRSLFWTRIANSRLK